LNLQATLENEFILLRPLLLEDKECLYDVAKDPEIWAQHPCKRNLRTEFDSFFQDSIESNAALIIIEMVNNEVIGSTRFKKVPGITNAIEIGWTFLSRKYWGGKYNKVVKELMIEYAFSFVDKVIFFVDKDNIRSQKAVEKINGKKASLSDFAKLTESKTGMEIYVIEKQDWYK